MKKIVLLVVIAVIAATTVNAQEKGQWAVGPKMNIYANTGDGAVIGLGAMGRYSFTDALRIEPAIVALLEDGCAIDASCDVQYLFDVADRWYVYPLVGLSANKFGEWSMGINIGAGADFAVADNWDITAGVKWMAQTHKYWKNPIVFSVGATYKF